MQGSAAGQGIYPEREKGAASAFDRLTGTIGFRLHGAFARQLSGAAAFAERVSVASERLGESPLASCVPELRYRLRRDGWSTEWLTECFALCVTAQARSGGGAVSAAVLGAARRLVGGGIVDQADADARSQALMLAAAAFALRGDPVHVLTSSTRRARQLADLLRAPLDLLGLGVGCIESGMEASARADAYAQPIVSAAARDVALAYLSDHLRMGGQRGAVRGMLGRLTGPRRDKAQFLLPGLRCALVDEADTVLLDDVFAPLEVTAESAAPDERLLYEQAIELGRAATAGVDFSVEDEGVRLTDAGRRRLTQLVAPLGGLWSVAKQREELTSLALEALHLREPNEHYRVAGDRVQFPPADPKEPSTESEEDANRAHILSRLIEVKEGCRLSVRRETLARISMLRFFGRYMHLAGVCADARGLERDLWDLYGLKTARAGPVAATVPCAVRVFRSADGKRGALLEAVTAAAAEGAVLIALRTPDAARTAVEAITQAGFEIGTVGGGDAAGDQAALERLARPGGVVVNLHPAERGVWRAQTGAVPLPLHMVVAELHDARRHITQLARAFGTGSCEVLLSLEDEAVAARIGRLKMGALRLRARRDAELPPRQAQALYAAVQREAEQARRLMRQDVVLREDYLRDMLAFSGGRH